MRSVGPLIPLHARWGGSLLLIGAVQFVLAMIVVQLKYPGYSDSMNFVSALGGPHSPWAVVYNSSVMLLGLLTIVGAYLLAAGFSKRKSRSVGLGLLILAGAGAFLTGLYPETSGAIHSDAASLTFLAGPLALLVLTFAMLRDTRWDGLRGYTFLSGLVTLVADVLFSLHAYAGLGLGGMERLIIAPLLLWGIVVGIHLLRLPAYRPPPLAKPHLA